MTDFLAKGKLSNLRTKTETLVIVEEDKVEEVIKSEPVTATATTQDELQKLNTKVDKLAESVKNIEDSIFRSTNLITGLLLILISANKNNTISPDKMKEIEKLLK